MEATSSALNMSKHCSSAPHLLLGTRENGNRVVLEIWSLHQTFSRGKQSHSGASDWPAFRDLFCSFVG